MMEIETLAEDLVDELTSAPSPTRAEAIEYVTGVLTALAIYHSRVGPANRPSSKAEVFWFERIVSHRPKLQRPRAEHRPPSVCRNRQSTMR